MKYVIIPNVCFIYKITRQSLYCITTTVIRNTSYVSLQRSTPHITPVISLIIIPHRI